VAGADWTLALPCGWFWLSSLPIFLEIVVTETDFMSLILMMFLKELESVPLSPCLNMRLTVDCEGCLRRSKLTMQLVLRRWGFNPEQNKKSTYPFVEWLVSLLFVHFLKNDVLNLASHFVSCGYLEGNDVFYMFLEDNEGRTKAVTDEVIATWSESWISVNAEFEHLLQSDADLQVFSGKMFMVWDGNHRL
jgi:hypothetical protein